MHSFVVTKAFAIQYKLPLNPVLKQFLGNAAIFFQGITRFNIVMKKMDRLFISLNVEGRFVASLPRKPYAAPSWRVRIAGNPL